MFSSLRLPRFAWLATLFVCYTTGAQTAYEAVFTLDAFAVQQTCVQSCFTHGYAGIHCYTDVLGSALGCSNSPCSSTWAAVDACYCRGDLQPAAHDWLSSCVNQLCTVGDNAVNLVTAVSIYSTYCAARGFTAQPAQNTAQTTTQTGVSASPTTGRSGSTSPTASSDTNTKSPPPASTSNTLIIALASVSAFAVIVILAMGVACWRSRRRRRLANHNPGPYTMGPWPVATHLLHPSNGSRISDGATDVTPSDSISQVNQPTMMGPSYPNYPEPSAFSTHIGGYGASSTGQGRGFQGYQGGMR